MRRAFAKLVAAGVVASAAVPALAQEGYVLPPPPPPLTAYPDERYPAPPQPMVMPPAPEMHYPAGTPVHPAPPAYGTYHDGMTQHYGAPGLPPQPSIGYTVAERDAWLADCRAQYYGKGKRTGGIIGGLIGAIGGGILGHEIADGSRTRRIGGTLIGAGVGGLAGLAIGAAIGASGDEKRIDECEAYLRQYTGGYAPGPGYGYGYGHGSYGYTTVMVPVQMQTRYTYSAPIRREHREVIEEVIEETVVVPRKTTKYVETSPAPATKYVKPVRTTK